MFNAASKLYFAVAAMAIVLGFGYVVASSDRVGFTALVFAGLGALGLGLAAFVLLPTEPVHATGGASASGPPVSERSEPAGKATDTGKGTFWAPAAAAAATLALGGLATDRSLLVLGIVAGLVVAFGWLGQAWREHPSWTAAMEHRLHDRFVVPIVLPATIFVLAGISVISLSRLLLAVSEKAAPFIVIVAAGSLLGLFYLLSNRDVGRQALATLAVVAAGLVAAAGIAGEAKGQRKVESEGAKGELVLKVHDVSFDTEELRLPSARAIELAFENEDTVQHNFALYDQPGGTALYQGAIVGKGKTVYKFTTPPAGTYYFQCDIHPTQMSGRVIVAPVTNAKPGGTGGSTDESTTTSTAAP